MSFNFLAATLMTGIGVPASPPSGISFVGGVAGESIDGSNLTAVLPAHIANDFALASLHGDLDTSVFALTVAAGWSQLFQVAHTTGRGRKSALFYKKFTSNSETNPVFTDDVSQEYSFNMLIFRGVHLTTPFDATFTQNNAVNSILPNAPAITTTTANAALVSFHGSTHDRITTAGAPAGMTLGPQQILGAANDHRQNLSAYVLDAGAAGAKLGTPWTHNAGVDDALPDYSVHTIALRKAA